MKDLTYSAAVGCGCLLSAGPTRLVAAEWSLTQQYSASADYDSNRRLEPVGRDTEASVLTADLHFKRALEDSDIYIEPRYSFRRYSDSTLGNGDDRSVFAGLDQLGERLIVNLTASYWDQSTLLTEQLETGIVSGNTHRRMTQAGSNWTWMHTERRQLIAQLSYVDVSYYGQATSLLPGYRYPSGSIGERFTFSERGSFTVSAFGSALSSSLRGNSNHEAGLQAEIIYAFSELTKLDATVGESARVLPSGSNVGTDASISLTHALLLGNLALGFTRSLVPYGTGVLVQRDQLTASATRPFTPYLDGTISLLRIENNRTTVELGLDRRSYSSATIGLSWHPAETWSLGAQIEGLRTQVFRSSDTVNEWRTSVSLNWSPRPQTRSR